jgi:hypothetical protein
MKQLSYQFKLEFGVSVYELAKLAGKTGVWASNFVSGDLKHQANIGLLIVLVSRLLGVSEDLISKYALGQVEIDYSNTPHTDYYLKKYAKRKKKIEEMREQGLLPPPQKKGRKAKSESKDLITREEFDARINKLLYGE